jgi:hypothetical protein
VVHLRLLNLLFTLLPACCCCLSCLTALSPTQGAVETDIAKISNKPESKVRRYFDKWRGDIDTALPFPSFQDAAVTWVGAFIG